MRGPGRHRLLGAGILSAALALGPAAAVRGATVAPGLTPPFGTNWTVYHQNLMGSGVDPVNTDLNTLKPGWSSPKLDGGIFGEPLVADGRVVVATANDTVYALSAKTGSVLWSTHLGTPVPVAGVPCPSVVSPIVGITGTPYIDLAKNEIFVVAMLQTSFTVQHRLYGLNLFDGSIELDQSADPPGSQRLQEFQRAGLTASQGRIVIAYTGFGDCGTYHGWVVGIPETGGSMLTYEAATLPGEFFGGIWMGGAAPVVDPAGHIWVSVGNGTVTSDAHGWDGSNSVIELSPGFRVLQRFGDPLWQPDNQLDFDLGSTNPALVNGFVFIVGKAGTAYLARQRHLGGVGGQVASLALCQPSRLGGSAWGGTAVDGSVVYVNCDDGLPGNAHYSHITAVQVTKKRPYLHVLWRATTVRTAGPPIVAGGKVWTILLRGQVVVGLSQASGQPELEAPIGVSANHFPTPAVADGLLLVPSLNQVLAFVGPWGLPPPPPAAS
jgi:polyvinyl alcohol dehydrogenase (cytochrome)